MVDNVMPNDCLDAVDYMLAKLACLITDPRNVSWRRVTPVDLSITHAYLYY